MQEDFVDVFSGDFQFANSHGCVRMGKHMKSVTSTGCCKYCGSNKIYFVPKNNGK